MRKIVANDDLMTTREAADQLGVAVRTVQLWVEAGSLPAWRTAGGHRRIARAAVDALMRDRSQVLAPLPSHVCAAADAGLQPAQGIKILVVEDDPILLRLTAQVMATWQFPVNLSTANNGFEALVRIGEVQPDLVVTDLHMPGMDGFQMLRTLKKAGSGYESLMVVVVSALSGADIAEFGGLPADVRFFAKPVHFGQLEDLVRTSFATQAA
ncbi:MAG: response regulator [Candidatus Saccharibacteria bacterium]|nr:response regulator [Rhodoferax sp.]